MPGIANPTTWLYRHSRLYVWLDRKFFEKPRHKRVLKKNAALRDAVCRLNDPAYLNDPDRTLW